MRDEYREIIKKVFIGYEIVEKVEDRYNGYIYEFIISNNLHIRNKIVGITILYEYWEILLYLDGDSYLIDIPNDNKIAFLEIIRDRLDDKIMIYNLNKDFKTEMKDIKGDTKSYIRNYKLDKIL